jgi:hypothetical protein
MVSDERDDNETPEIDDETTFAIHEDVLTEEIDGELVILDLEGDVYFSLNAVGRLVWEAAERGDSFAAIVDEICETYDEVGREQAAEDAAAFLGEALAEELMRVE